MIYHVSQIAEQMLKIESDDRAVKIAYLEADMLHLRVIKKITVEVSFEKVKKRSKKKSGTLPGAVLSHEKKAENGDVLIIMPGLDSIFIKRNYYSNRN